MHIGTRAARLDVQKTHLHIENLHTHLTMTPKSIFEERFFDRADTTACCKAKLWFLFITCFASAYRERHSSGGGRVYQFHASGRSPVSTQRQTIHARGHHGLATNLDACSLCRSNSEPLSSVAKTASQTILHTTTHSRGLG